MTPKQKRVYDAIKAGIERDGVAPTFGELQAKLGFASKSAVARAVDLLVEQGKLVKRPGRARGLSLASIDLSSVPLQDLLAELGRRNLGNG